MKLTQRILVMNVVIFALFCGCQKKGSTSEQQPATEHHEHGGHKNCNHEGHNH